MWSDNDIDNAFQRLNPPEPEPTPFPLDGWLRLEAELDKAVIERAVRQKLWKFFAAEVAVVALIALGWLLWPTGLVTPTRPLATKPNSALPTTLPTQPTNLTSTALLSPTRRAAGPLVATALTPAAGTAIVPLVSPAVSATPATGAVGRPTAQLTQASAAVPQALALGEHHPRRQLAGLAEARPRSRRGHLAADGAAATYPPLAAPALPDDVSRQTGLVTRGQTNPTAAKRPGGTAWRLDQPVAAPATATAGVAAASKAGGPGVSREVPRLGRPASGGIAVHKKQASARIQRPTTPASIEVAKHNPGPGAGASAALVAGTATNEGAGAAAVAEETSALAPVVAGLPVALAPALPAPLAAGPLAPSDLPRPVGQPRFYIGLVGAPDVSTVKFAGTQSPLLNAGLVLEYRLGHRLRLSTGLLRSTKKYVANRDDYDWGAYKALVYSHDFKDVDAVCTLLDVPLNLRYDVLVHPRYRLFGSAGLSSYFIQHEEYDYDYVENNVTKRWYTSASNQSRHLLSILNLSAGYERNLGRRWSLQAEPYLKLPLSGLGKGQVWLTSAGVFVGVKYGL